MPAAAGESIQQTVARPSALDSRPPVGWRAFFHALNAAWLSFPLVTFFSSLFSTPGSLSMQSQSSTSMEPAPSSLAEKKNNGKSGLNLCALPDELVGMCYAALPASDLVALEQVSRRMRELVSLDTGCWRTCTLNKWGSVTNKALLSAAARYAGSWKKLYAKKSDCDSQNAPWLVPCTFETQAIFDLVKGSALRIDPERNRIPSLKPARACSVEGSSPRTVMNLEHLTNDTSGVLSVVMLIDGSSSVTEDDFTAMKNFSKNLVKSLRETNPDSEVALVQFNQYPRVESQLTNVSRSTILHVIDTMDQMMGSTDIAAPIRRARQILDEEAGPGEKAIVLLTDGQTHADELHESEKEARTAASQSGARMFTLGVGRDVDAAGLSRVATGCLTGSSSTDLSQGSYFTLRRMAVKE